MRSIRAVAVAVIGLLGVACGGDGGDDGTGPTPDVTVTIAVGALSGTVTPGGTAATIPITINKPASFTGSVTLTATAPSGLTAFLAPSVLSGAVSTSTLTITAAPTLTPGSYNVTVTASGTGVTTSSIVATVVVNAPPPPPTFTVAATQTAFTIQAGLEATTAVTITRENGYDQPVTLAVTGGPVGVGASFSPTSVTGTTSTMTLAVTPVVAPGTYNLVLRANGAGVAERTIPLTLTVTPAGSFGLTAAPAALTIVAGQSASSTITITRTEGYAGAVALTSTGAPTGVAVSFAPTSVTTGVATSQMTVVVDATVTAGSHTITVRGNGPNVSEQTTTVALTITAGSFTIAAAPTAVSVQAGQSGTSTVTITRVNGYSQAVAMTATGVPAGVQAVFAPASVTGTTSTLSFDVGAGVTPGAYPITVRANGPNVAEQTSTVTLTVTAAPPAGTFTIAAAPTALSVEQGQQGTSTVTITRLNAYAAAVALTSSGAPAGVGVVFSPASVTATTSTVTFTVGSAVAAGAYPITLRANGTGVAEQTAVVTLTVTAAPVGGSGNVTWRFCGTESPLWFAAQDGNGAWARVLPSSPGIFQFNVASGTGGVAYVQADGAGFEKSVYFASQAELIQVGTSFCPNATGKTINGTVTGAASFDLVNIALGGRTAQLTPGVSAFSIANVPDGPRDLVAGRVSLFDFTTLSSTSKLERIFLRRNVNVANNGSVGTVDFNGAESFAPVQRSLTLTNTSGHQLQVTTLFETLNNGSSALLGLDLTSAATTRPWFAVPSDRQIAGDRHTVIASAIPALDPISALNGRSVLFFTSAPQDQTIAFGPSLSGAVTTVVGTAPYVRMRTTYATPQADYNRYFVAAYNQDASGGRVVQVNMSAAYAGGSPNLAVPDFSAVSGFNNDWGLKSGSQLTWTFSAVGWTGGGIGGPTADGAIAKSAQAGAQITP
jgi:uncharacterized membrane protein